MKESERIKLEMGTTDNDLRLVGLSQQYDRALRGEEFEKHWLPALSFVIDVGIGKNGCYEFYHNEKRVQYYPKANKLLFTAENRWQTGGLKWIKKTFNLENV